MSIKRPPSSDESTPRPSFAPSRWGHLLLSLPVLWGGQYACSSGQEPTGPEAAPEVEGSDEETAGAVPESSLPPASDPGLIGEEAPAEEPEVTPPAGPPQPPPPTGSLSGVAWMPGNSPEQVEEAQAMPASSALVQLTKEAVAAYPEEAYCNLCIKPDGYFATTDAKGLFMLADVPEGTYVLTVEKGQFRKQREVTIVADQVLAAETEWTTLPSSHAPESGEHMPRIAMVIGQFDRAQFVLGKLGIGTKTFDMWTPGTAMNRVDVYQGDDALDRADQIATLSELVGNFDRLKQYHLVVIPCGPRGVPEWLKQAGNLENLRNYVALGGGLFFTGWAGTYADALFPAQLEFIEDETPANAYDVASNSWDPALFRSVDKATIKLKPEPRIVDPDLSAWLVGQQALDALDEGAFKDVVDAHIWGGNMDAQIATINEVTLGLDASGNPVVDTPRILVDAPTEDGARAPLGVLFRPAGCGRVMYSSYELDGRFYEGSTPVERVLMYSFMELSVCEGAKPPEVEEPPPPDKPPVPIPLPK